MNNLRNTVVWFAFIVLCTLACPKCYTQTNSQIRVASLLSTQFETLVYTKSELLASADEINRSANASRLKMNEQTLRLPFLELIGGLSALGPTTVNNLKRSYSGVFIGAKDFISPEGIGMVSSRNCYIALARSGTQQDIVSDSHKAQQQVSNGRQVWTWSLPPFEGHPTSTDFYATNLDGLYFVMANDRRTFEEVAEKLTSAETSDTFTLPNSASAWKTFSKHDYWAYRLFKRNGVKDTTAAGLTNATSNALALAFFTDSYQKESTIQVFTSDKSPFAFLPSLPNPFQPSGVGVWKATIPLSNDESGKDALVEVLYYIGFGLFL